MARFLAGLVVALALSLAIAPVVAADVAPPPLPVPCVINCPRPSPSPNLPPQPSPSPGFPQPPGTGTPAPDSGFSGIEARLYPGVAWLTPKLGQALGGGGVGGNWFDSVYQVALEAGLFFLPLFFVLC